MTKQKQHKNIRITKEKNMYKIIKNNTFKLVDAGAWMKYIFFSEQAPWA